MIARTKRRSGGGFTLIEMLASMVVMTLILAAVAAAFIAVQGSFQAEAQIKGTVEGGRTGLSYLERVVSMAGYGLEPQHAFSMATAGLPGSTKDNHSSASPDFVTDDLALRYRDPAYLRRGALAAGTLTLEGSTEFDASLQLGQALLIACPGGQDYAVVKTLAAVAASAGSAPVASYGAPFADSSAACLSASGPSAPYVMLMHELRLRVREVGGRPYLVAYRDLAVVPPGTDADYDPIAADVEDFQVAYLMNRPPPGGVSPDGGVLGGCCSALAAIDAAGNGDWVLGDAPGDPLPSEATTPEPTARTAYDDASRYNLHPANIRGVRLSVALRSSRAEPTTRKAFPARSLENHLISAPIADGYFRTVMTTTIAVPNLTSRAFFTPPLRTSSADPDLNSWGG